MGIVRFWSMASTQCHERAAIGEEETACLSEHQPDHLHRPTIFSNPFDLTLTCLSLSHEGQEWQRGRVLQYSIISLSAERSIKIPSKLHDC